MRGKANELRQLGITELTANTDTNKNLVVILGVAGIVLVGLGLRTVYVGTTPFENGDEVSTAWTTIWYLPRDWLRIFRLGQGSVEPNPIGIITWMHGPLQVMIAYVWVTVVAQLGARITELMWHLPFALLGSFAVLMTYLLGSTLQSRRAGILAALFVCVIPAHVGLSRTSGESSYILASLLQVTSIFLWSRYLATKRKSFVLATGVAVALDMLTDFAFAGLILTLIFFSLIYQLTVLGKITIKLVLSDLLQWGLILPILASTAVHAYALLQALRSNQSVGMFGRVLSEAQNSHTRVGGFFLIPAVENLAYATNLVTILIVAVSIIAFLFVRRARTVGTSAALFWACIYLLPFAFLFERVQLIGDFLAIAVALGVFVALVFDRLWDMRSVEVGLATGIVVVSLFLSAISAVFGVATLGVLDHPQYYGHVGIDRGTKTAALWVRQNTTTSTLLFTDAYAQQSQSLSLYYYHRPVVSMELGPESSMEKSIQLLSDNLSMIDVIVIGAEHLNLLPNEVRDQFETSAEITVNGKPSLYILRHGNPNNGNPSPAMLESSVYNSRYDELYSNLSEIIALPFREIQASQTEVKQ